VGQPQKSATWSIAGDGLLQGSRKEVFDMTTRVESKQAVRKAPVGAKAPAKARVAVVAASATAVAAVALAVVSAAEADPTGVVLALYLGVVAVAVAPLIVAEIRAQDAIDAAGATAHTHVKLVRPRPGEAVVVGETDGMLVIDASAGDVRVHLPEPSAFGNRMLTFERIDRSRHHVLLDPPARSLVRADGEVRLFVADGVWTALDD
jgi:hypothetical protein